MIYYGGFNTTAIGFFISNTYYADSFKTAAIGFFISNGSFKTAQKVGKEKNYGLSQRFVNCRNRSLQC